MKNLAQKLVKVIADLGGKVNKSGYNSHQNYHYITEADLLDAIRPSLAKYNISIFSSAEEVDVREIPTKNGVTYITTVKMKYTLVDGESGDSFDVYSWGTGADTQDKGYYKAVTGASKYFLLKNFLLSGDDDPENDSDVPNKTKATQNRAKSPSGSFKTKTSSEPTTGTKKASGGGFGVSKGASSSTKSNFGANPQETKVEKDPEFDPEF